MSKASQQFRGTQPVSEAHSFDQGALSEWLQQNLDGFQGPLQVEMFKGGQSNPTYKLVTPDRTYVMRAKPGPVAKLLPSAHAIEREFRVMNALHDSDVPVARMHVLCDDESIIGRAFYIMEYVQGRIFWDPTLPDLEREQRGPIYDEMNHVIAALHKVDFRACGLESYGKPGNYIERQIHRWSKQYKASQTQPIPQMDDLIAWLPDHVPDIAKRNLISIVHGDYRLDNMVFHPTEPRVLAVLDWELSTLGHPLADFSYHCMAWHINADLFRGIGGRDLDELGIPAEMEYMRRYCERTDFTTPDELAANWSFFMAYNMFRISAILQGIAKRVEDGTASSKQAREAGARARPMAELAWNFMQQAG